MSGRRQLHNGRFLVASGGRAAVHEDCCCAAGPGPGVDCDFCPEGEVPYQFSVAMSGITSCGCINDVYGTRNSVIATCEIDAVFLLTQTETNPCRWENDDVGTLSVTHYARKDCSDELGHWSETMAVRAYMIITLAGMFLLLRPFLDFGGGNEYHYTVFGSEDVGTDCEEPVILEDIGTCYFNRAAGSITWSKVCTDGVATVTPV